MIKNILIVGAGGFGREVLFWAKDTFCPLSYNIKGFIVSTLDNTLTALPLPIFNEETYSININDYFLVAIGDPDIKKKAYNTLNLRGANFISLIHPSSIVLPTVKIGSGVIICPHSVISDNVILEDFTSINLNVTVGHDAIIKSFSTLSPHVSIGGKSTIGSLCLIGSNASVSPKVILGDKSRVTANSFVCHNTSIGSLVIGVPGKEYQDIY
ncbi:MAG: acetyltransferase [Smithella sp.]